MSAMGAGVVELMKVVRAEGATDGEADVEAVIVVRSG